MAWFNEPAGVIIKFDVSDTNFMVCTYQDKSMLVDLDCGIILTHHFDYLLFQEYQIVSEGYVEEDQ